MSFIFFKNNFAYLLKRNRVLETHQFATSILAFRYSGSMSLRPHRRQWPTIYLHPTPRPIHPRPARLTHRATPRRYPPPADVPRPTPSPAVAAPIPSTMRLPKPLASVASTPHRQSSLKIRT